MKSSARSRGPDYSPLARRARKAFSCLVEEGPCFGVAVSGGSDSMALLMLAADFCQATGASLIAFTVDHGLRPEAKDEARFVATTCRAMGVPHQTMRWERRDDAPVSQAAARRARYTLMANAARRNGVRTIALGHTRDDRLETFLMRARAGSGWHGLAGPMPNGALPFLTGADPLHLVRPLLAFGREELREELRARGVGWIEDPSNAAERFERVRMRRLLARMDAGARAKTLRVMDRLMALRSAVMTEAHALVAELKPGNPTSVMGIPLGTRAGVGDEAWRRFVEAMVMTAGCAERAPRRDALDRLLARIATRDPSLSRGATLAGATIRIRKDDTLCFAKAPPRRGSPANSDGEKPDWGRAAALLAHPDLRVLRI